MILLVAQKGIIPFEGSVVAEFFQDEDCLYGANFFLFFETKWDFISVSYTCWNVLFLCSKQNKPITFANI